MSLETLNLFTSLEMSKPKSMTDEKHSSRKGAASNQKKERSKAVAAVMPLTRSARIAIEDCTLDLSWVAGSVYIGNGTLGVTGSIYFQDLQANIWSSNVPIYFRDTSAAPLTVQNYISDITKHFAWYHVDKLAMEMLARLPATNVSTSVAVAPYRGGYGFTPQYTASGTPAANSTAQILSMKGGHRVPSWSDDRMDMTDYVDGGKGADARRFPTSYDAGGRASATYFQFDTVGSSFIIGGVGDVSQAGMKTHDVIIRARVRLIDFVGSNFLSNDYGVSAPRAPAGPVSNESKAEQLASAGALTAVQMCPPILTRQTGYVMVRQEDVPPLSQDKGRVPPNDPNRRP